jgi:hypothetical protein
VNELCAHLSSSLHGVNELSSARELNYISIVAVSWLLNTI